MIACATLALALPRGWLYLQHMAQPGSVRHDLVSAAPSSGVRIAIIWGGGSLLALMVLAAALLWYHYGTAVFFEAISSGIASCF